MLGITTPVCTSFPLKMDDELSPIHLRSSFSEFIICSSRTVGLKDRYTNDTRHQRHLTTVPLVVYDITYTCLDRQEFGTGFVRGRGVGEGEVEVGALWCLNCGMIQFGKWYSGLC